MDNNFYVPQNYEQQQISQRPKKKTSLIIGIVAVVLLLSAMTVILVLVLSDGKETENKYEAAKTEDIIGTWFSEEGFRFEFYEDGTGEIVYYAEDMMYEHCIPISWWKKGNKVTIAFEDGTEKENEEYMIVDISKTELILEDENGEQYTYTK